MKNKMNQLTYILFAVYLFSLVWIILFKFDLSFTNIGSMRNMNLIPYSEPTRLNGEIVRSEMYLNMLIFVPFGVYLDMLFKKWHFIKKTGSLIVASLFLEGLQYLLAVGISDITDVIHNVIGGLIGILLYKMIEKLLQDQSRAQNIMNRVALLGTVSMVSILIIFDLSSFI